jgi:hypothetical protein
MINELVDMLPKFPGAANRCRCFLHIVNLITKSLLKQFDIPKKDINAAIDAAEWELLKVAVLPDVEGDDEIELEDSWESIKTNIFCMFC